MAPPAEGRVPVEGRCEPPDGTRPPLGRDAPGDPATLPPEKYDDEKLPPLPDEREKSLPPRLLPPRLLPKRSAELALPREKLLPPELPREKSPPPP